MACLDAVNQDEMDLSAMDQLFIQEMDQLQEFQEMVGLFESILQTKDDEFCDKTSRESNEYNLWQTMLESDISHYESLIQSYTASLQDMALNYETIAVKKSLEEQKTFVFETEVNKLRNKYDNLCDKIDTESLSYMKEYDVLVGVSKKYGKQIIFSSNVFGVILSFIDIENIFKLERVSVSWYDAIHSWKGWIISSQNMTSIQNNLGTMNKYRNIIDNNMAISEASSSNHSNENDRLYYPRFRRFALSIETQKNNMYQVEIVGYSDVHMNASSSISHDKSRKRVTIQPIEGQKQFAKEFSICDVILGNHQRLARMKEKCERLKSRCESDKSTQRGYQMTTRELQQEIMMIDKEVKEYELQQRSDLNTIKFMKQQIMLKEEELNELKHVPEQLTKEEEENRRMFAIKMANVESEENQNNMNQKISKTQKEKNTLTKAIKFEQANLRSITQKRDELKQKYEWLKNQITKLTNTNDLL
eukprot:60880_1